MRSKNPEKYDPLFWDVLEAAAEGRVIDLSFPDVKAARGWRTNYYAFISALEWSFRTGGRGLSPANWERLQRRRDDYGRVAAFLVEGGIRIMLRSLTPQSQALRAQFEASLAQDAHPAVRPDLAEASARRLAERLGQAPADPEGEAADDSGLPLGRKNPYY